MHVVVIGGGIIGLAVAHELAARGHRPTVLEKETAWARHQTGRNSGVIHAGLYYKPGSLKARLCTAGTASMTAFARDNGVPFEVCGKLVVATAEEELPRLHELARRAEANGVPAKLVEPAQAREYEPEVSCVAALHVESTGIVDYTAVCEVLVRRLRAAGADLRLGAEVTAITGVTSAVRVITTTGEFEADAVVNCAGLHSDHVARLAGLTPEARIVPFRGEYYELTPDAAHLVRGLIYPVPDPAFPFLGVHLTRGIDGGVHAGPNAVLALRREGYRWRDVQPRELADTLTFPGFWRLARKNVVTGAGEIGRSLSRTRFARALARLVPAVRPEHLVRAPAGVRAQAMRRDGSLVDDFLFHTAPRQVHVLNAPSPGATASLEIAKRIADELTTATP
ncbi:MAG TPA: L-2-hydroxyglutarate oxidase [Pseudonocardiaceae bacterium]